MLLVKAMENDIAFARMERYLTETLGFNKVEFTTEAFRLHSTKFGTFTIDWPVPTTSNLMKYLFDRESDFMSFYLSAIILAIHE